MRGKRCLVAIIGLLGLFICAYFGVKGDIIGESQVADSYNDRQQSISYQVDNMAIKKEVRVEKTRGEDESNITSMPQTMIQKVKRNVYQNKAREITFSGSEYNVLLRIVEAEATGGTMKSKKMVANVILNRVADSHFPNTISEVVFQRTETGAQFSPITDGRFWSVSVTDSTKKAVKSVVEGEDQTQGALFFVNRKTANAGSLNWFDRRLSYLFECGGHSFYKF